MHAARRSANIPICMKESHGQRSVWILVRVVRQIWSSLKEAGEGGWRREYVPGLVTYAWDFIALRFHHQSLNSYFIQSLLARSASTGFLDSRRIDHLLTSISLASLSE